MKPARIGSIFDQHRAHRPCPDTNHNGTLFESHAWDSSCDTEARRKEAATYTAMNFSMADMLENRGRTGSPHCGRMGDSTGAPSSHQPHTLTHQDTSRRCKCINTGRSLASWQEEPPSERTDRWLRSPNGQVSLPGTMLRSAQRAEPNCQHPSIVRVNKITSAG